jgi:predicted nucleotidyltransferase
MIFCCTEKMMTVNNTGLDETLRLKITDILRRYTQVTEAVLYGSRAKGTHRVYSDIDIALFGDCDPLFLERIHCDFDDLPTVYTFDLVGYDSIKNEALREHINRVGVKLYEK